MFKPAPMSGSRVPWWMWVIAATFLAYFGLLVYCDLARPEAEGIELGFPGGQMVVTRVVPASPAARAGIRAGDRIEGWNGQAVEGRLDLTAVETNIEIDQPIRLGLRREGRAIETTLVLRRAPATYWRRQAGASLLVVRFIQVVTLAFGLFLAFRRPSEAAARVGGWLLATAGVFCVVLPYRIAAVWRSLPLPVGTLLWIPFLSSLVIPAILLTFFALFPVRRIRSRWVWVGVWTPMLLAVAPDAYWTFRMVHDPQRATPVPDWFTPLLVVSLTYLVAMIALLTQNYRRVGETTERRRLRVLLVGTAVGCGSGGVLTAFFWLSSSHLGLLGSPAFILGTFCVLATPLSFTYAILRHRLFDVTVIIRQGVQYAVARNVLLSVVPAVMVLLAVDLLIHRDEPIAGTLATRAWIYVVLAVIAFVAHRYRGGWLEALDRRFFRERYDASRLLRQVAEDLRTSRSLDRVATKVVTEIEAALHPEFVALLVGEPGAPLYQTLASAGGRVPAPIDAGNKVLELLRVLGKPLDIPAGGELGLLGHLPGADVARLQDDAIEMLVPVATDPGERRALVALGLKRSEEPYSSEDRELLSTIALSLALLIEQQAASPPSDDSVSECPTCGACSDAGQATCGADGAELVQVRIPRFLAGRYRLERRLGRGGMGTVYEARDGALDRAVAVKLLREDLVGNPDAAERFRQEARTAAAFAHPNVVTVHDFGVTSGRAYLVMELLNGATLREAIRQRARFVAADAMPILRGVSAAVAAAHERQIVHRDLKPENIFLVRNGNTEVTKVLDFGIAKFVGVNQAQGLTGAGTDMGLLLGTLPYMAPEQLRGEEVTPGWDLWALAIITCEMLTGRHPFALMFTGASTAASQIPLPGSLSELSPRCQAFFARALAAEPERRPSSAALFLAELEQALPTE